MFPTTLKMLYAEFVPVADPLRAPAAMTCKRFVPFVPFTQNGTRASRQRGPGSPCSQQVHFGKAGKPGLTPFFFPPYLSPLKSC